MNYDEDITLYKNEDDGKRRMWRIVREGNKHKTFSGLEGGAITETNWTESQGKNIGNINATTPEEQASLDIAVKVRHKREKGFSETGDAPVVIDGREWTSPTLAQKWDAAKHRMSFPCFTSPKLDGIRCICDKDGMWSRNGKEFVGAPHIRRQLQPLFDESPDLILDGELYNHSLREDFDKICSIIKKKRPTPADLAESEKHMQYWVFDIKQGPDVEPSFPFKVRYSAYRDLLMENIPGAHGKPCWHRRYDDIFAVRQFICDDELAVVKSCQKFIEDGFEGGMIRDPGAPYVEKRSHMLLKYKLFIDKEFEVIDVEEGAGNRAGMMGRIKMKTKDGKVFDASAKGSHDFFKRLLEEKDEVIGKMATVQFQNYTPRGIPRFPVVVSIRDYE